MDMRFGSDNDPFVEIEIYQTNHVHDPVAISSTDDDSIPPAGEIRAKFYAMRRIARENLIFESDKPEAFYLQAQFMKDFTDDYPEQEAFTAYFPTYQQMNEHQLRTYFTWRTGVREGNVTETSLSYAFVYIYELLNNVGVTGASDGLDKLVAFWKAFRGFDPVIDRYVLQWIKDYHVYYPLARSFGDFARENKMTMHYPAVFAYGSGKEDSFDIFAGISGYNIRRSVFYNEQTREMISDCFYYILSRIRERFEAKGKRFEDLIFFADEKENQWRPFNRALFFPALGQKFRQTAISEREVYTCHYGRWTYTPVMVYEHGRGLVGYFMKEMEAALRGAVKFKHKINADPGVCGGKTLKKLAGAGIIFPQFIRECVADFYTDMTRKVVSVDMMSLHIIRQEAMRTQEKLIVDVIYDEIIVHDVWTAVPDAPTGDVWTQLKESFSLTELEVLKIALNGGDLKAFAVRNMIMPEVLADGINQKAADCIGDSVIELDPAGHVIVYEDYRDDLAELAGS